ncbi:MAG TPA: hypothetical protein VIU64_11820, partial [Polyangia bacterium]
SGIDLHSAAPAAPTFFQGSQPDYVPRVYSFLHAAHAQARVNPIADVAPTFFQAVTPERALPASALRASAHPFATSIPPAPEKTIAQPFTIAPERIVRAMLTAERQLSATSIPPQPERKAPLAGVTVPDAIARHIAHASRQLAVTGEPPAPERTAPMASVSWPDRLDIRGAPAAHQFAATALSPRPEQALPEPSVTAPERVPRSTLPIAAHPFAASAPVAPERTVPMASVIAPDKTEPRWRPELRDWLALYPLPLPVATVQALSVAVYPDATRGGGQPAHEHQAWAAPHLPPPVPTFFQGSAPERVHRPFLQADRQQAWAGPTAPVAALAPTFFAAAFPDILLRAAPTLLRTETTRSLAPERTVPLAAVVAPEILPRRPRGPEHLPPGALPSAPERTAPLAVVDAPARLHRAPLPALGASALPPMPEGRIVLDWQPSMPERASGKSAQTPHAAAVQPPELAPTPWVSSPDVARSVALAMRGDFSVLSPLPVAPAAVPTLPSSSYPDIAPVGFRPAALYQLGGGLPRLPPGPSPSPIIVVRVGQNGPTSLLLPLADLHIVPAALFTVTMVLPTS